jgi:uncharacterized protein YuzE
VKLHYDPETDSLYVEFQRRPSVDTRELAPDVRLDLDEKGRPVGLDIDHASECSRPRYDRDGGLARSRPRPATTRSAEPPHDRAPCPNPRLISGEPVFPLPPPGSHLAAAPARAPCGRALWWRPHRFPRSHSAG